MSPFETNLFPILLPQHGRTRDGMDFVDLTSDAEADTAEAVDLVAAQPQTGEPVVTNAVRERVASFTGAKVRLSDRMIFRALSAGLRVLAGVKLCRFLVYLARY